MYEPKWPHFKQLQFLDDYISARKTKFNLLKVKYLILSNFLGAVLLLLFIIIIIIATLHYDTKLLIHKNNALLYHIILPRN